MKKVPQKVGNPTVNSLFYWHFNPQKGRFLFAFWIYSHTSPKKTMSLCSLEKILGEKGTPRRSSCIYHHMLALGPLGLLVEAHKSLWLKHYLVYNATMVFQV